MLTPIFSITQDLNYLYITIKAPNARISETQIEYEDQDFRFFSKPYYLRLTLPSKIIENGDELVDYESKSGTFMIRVSKLNTGEHFEGLEFLTKLLSNNNNKLLNKKPLIEVFCEQQVDSENNNPIESIDEDFDWYLEQTVRQESDELLLSGEKYGFANQYSGVIARIVEEFNDLIDIKDPEHKNSAQRREERLKAETMHFSDDHYLSDMFDQKDIISRLLLFEAFVGDTQSEHKFNDDERFRLKNLPKNEYILDKNVKKSLLLGMIDILFAYAYDIRVNESEHNVESGWNVCKLSATLSSFDSFSSLKEVIVTSIRRSLCYPLYREWNLSLKVLSDVITILNLGQNYVIKCFLDIHQMFNESGDGRYLINDLYITDYCVWLQYVKHNIFESLASALKNIKVTKTDINLDLDVLERAAELAIEEQSICESNNTLNEEPNNNCTESSDESEELMHKTSSECSSETTETSFSSSESSEKQWKKEDNENIDSDDDFPTTTTANSVHNYIDSNDSDDESSSTDFENISKNISINDKNS